MKKGQLGKVKKYSRLRGEYLIVLDDCDHAHLVDASTPVKKLRVMRDILQDRFKKKAVYKKEEGQRLLDRANGMLEIAAHGPNVAGHVYEKECDDIHDFMGGGGVDGPCFDRSGGGRMYFVSPRPDFPGINW